MNASTRSAFIGTLALLMVVAPTQADLNPQPLAPTLQEAYEDTRDLLSDNPDNNGKEIVVVRRLLYEGVEADLCEFATQDQPWVEELPDLEGSNLCAFLAPPSSQINTYCHPSNFVCAAAGAGATYERLKGPNMWIHTTSGGGQSNIALFGATVIVTTSLGSASGHVDGNEGVLWMWEDITTEGCSSQFAFTSAFLDILGFHAPAEAHAPCPSDAN